MTPHVVVRAAERYGVRLTLADVRRLTWACLTGRVQVLHRGPEETVYGATARKGGPVLPLVFKGSKIVTVLPRGDRRVHAKI